MKTISREELKEKLDRGDDFRLVMTMGQMAYDLAHIPGSDYIGSVQEARTKFERDDEIVVYCSDKACIASVAAYRYMINEGFTNVRRYEGGLSDWQDAGYLLEGQMVDD